MPSIRDTWRAAALRDQLQYYGTLDPLLWLHSPPAGYNRPPDGGEMGHCALTILREQDQHPDMPIVEELRCPTCDDARAYGSPSDLMVHVNNVHRWTWLDLANKFPPILPEDTAGAFA